MQRKLRARSKEHKKHIESIVKYEHAVGGWVVLMNFLGLPDKCTLDEFAIRMAQLQDESEKAKKALAELLNVKPPEDEPEKF